MELGIRPGLAALLREAVRIEDAELIPLASENLSSSVTVKCVVDEFVRQPERHWNN